MKSKHPKKLEQSNTKTSSNAELYLRFQKSPAMQALAPHFKEIFEQSFAEDDQETLTKLSELLDQEDAANSFIAELQHECLEECLTTVTQLEKRRKKSEALHDQEEADQEKALENLKQILN